MLIFAFLFHTLYVANFTHSQFRTSHFIRRYRMCIYTYWSSFILRMWCFRCTYYPTDGKQSTVRLTKLSPIHFKPQPWPWSDPIFNTRFTVRFRLLTMATDVVKVFRYRFFLPWLGLGISCRLIGSLLIEQRRVWVICVWCVCVRCVWAHR